MKKWIIFLIILIFIIIVIMKIRNWQIEQPHQYIEPPTNVVLASLER